MMKQKTHHDVRGQRINCPDYEMCPLCYGCRAFNPKYAKCITCKEENAKQNLCKTERHRSDLLEKMITREKIVIS